MVGAKRSCEEGCAGVRTCGADGTWGECETCEQGQRCVSGQCVCEPGSCADGCCQGNTCVPGTAHASCGKGGEACESCSGVCDASRRTLLDRLTLVDPSMGQVVTMRTIARMETYFLQIAFWLTLALEPLAFLMTSAAAIAHGRYAKNASFISAFIGAAILCFLASALLPAIGYLIHDMFPSDMLSGLSQAQYRLGFFYYMGIFWIWTLIYFGVASENGK